MYRLVEQEYTDGRVFYVVERHDEARSAWMSVYRSSDIEEARKVLNERRNQVKKVKVIE